MRATLLFVATLLVAGVSREARADPVFTTCGTATSYPTPSTPASCATFKNFLPDGSMSFCAGIVDYPYYLPGGATQLYLEQQIALQVAAQASNPASALLPSLPPKCINHLKRQACLSAFMKCEYVDPFFADTTCGTQACTACGAPATLPAGAFTPTNLSPGYGSICVDVGTGNNPTTAKTCVAGPGKVPGMGDLGWSQLWNLTGTATDSFDAFCASKGLKSNGITCLTAIPRSPCKSVCDKTSRMDTVAASDCPIITGVFVPILAGPNTTSQWLTSTDTYVQAQSAAAFAKGMANNMITEISVLGLLGARPDCMKNFMASPSTNVYNYPQTYTMQTFGGPEALSLGYAIYAKANYINSTSGEYCQAVGGLLDFTTGDPKVGLPAFPADKPPGTLHCDALMNTISRCHAGGGNAYPAPGMAVGADEPLPPLCQAHINHPKAQPSAIWLAGLTAQLGNKSTSVHYVPSAPGLPQFAGMFQQPLNANNQSLCSTRDPVLGTLYQGKTSAECIINRATAAYNLIPPFIDPECQVAFRQFLCASAFMKLDYKSICLVKEGCAPSPEIAAATNTSVPFNLALPRFPSYDVCMNVHNKCGAFKAQLGAPGSPKRDAFEANVNCTKTVVSKCSDNADGWASGVWNCDGSQPLRQYPEGSGQMVANLYTPLKDYLTFANISQSLALSWGFSNSMNDTIAPFIGTSNYSQGLCSCPSPLLIPDDENAPTLAPGVCCAMRCTGYMYTDEQFAEFISIQSGLAAASLVLAFCVFITFASLKRSGVIIYFSFCVMMIALIFIVPNGSSKVAPYEAGGTLCKDNTQPNTQKDGGACLFQGVWMTYWTLAAVSWWLCAVVELFSRIARSKTDTSANFKFYHLYSWVAPVIPVIIFGATDSFGYSTGNTWCMLADVPNGSGLELGLLYGFIVAMVVVGGILILATLLSVVSKGASLKNNYANTLFVLAFTAIWAIMFSIRFIAEAQSADIAASAMAWVGCMVSNVGAGIPDPATNPAANNSALAKYGLEPGEGCGELFPMTLSVAGGTFNAVISYTNGFVIFAIFLPEMLRLCRAKMNGEDTVADSAAPAPTKKGDEARVAAYMDN